MAGIYKLYVVGGAGGYMGSDGVSPVEFMILVGVGSRMWMEPSYHNRALTPLGNVRTIIPEGPTSPDAVLDACLAFAPEYFAACPSMAAVRAEVGTREQLDFDGGTERVAPSWRALREEARDEFARIGLWEAELTALRPA